MDSALNYLNNNFCFGLVGKSWVVCKFSGSSVWTALKDEKVCMKSQKTKWKRIREACRHTSEVKLEIGDPVFVTENGIEERYYVIDSGYETEGKTDYILGR